MKPGDGLRDLARKIEAVAREHPEWSRAHEIVLNCTNHLTAVARCSDANHGVRELTLHDLECTSYSKSVGEIVDDEIAVMPAWPFNKGERK